MEKYIIEANDVSKIYPMPSGEDFYALRNISVKIPENKLTILRGRSGSGKTTLMNMLCALDKVSEGKVYFDGKDVTEMDDDACSLMRRDNIGFVFQSVALIPMMTAYENVEFSLRLNNYKGNMHERVIECLKMVGLAGRAGHLPEELSGGEQQRVAIARAIAHKPKVIFADEPTAELDSKTGLQVVKIFKDLVKEEGNTIVMTTHDIGFMEIGDLVYELSDGQILKTYVNGKEVR